MHRAALEEADGEEDEQRQESSSGWSLFSWPWASSGSSGKGSGATGGGSGDDAGAGGGEKGGAQEGPQNMRITGADGPVASIINGDYSPSPSMYNGKMLYRNKDNPNVWLRYVTAGGLKQWRVSTSKSLNANNDKGYLYNEEPGLDLPSSGKMWYVWMGSRWMLQKSVMVTAVEPEPIAPKKIDAEDGLFHSLMHWVAEYRWTAGGLLLSAWAGVLAYLWSSWKQAVKK